MAPNFLKLYSYSYRNNNPKVTAAKYVSSIASDGIFLVYAAGHVLR